MVLFASRLSVGRTYKPHRDNRLRGILAFGEQQAEALGIGWGECANNVLIDLDAKRQGDLLHDSRIAPGWIALLHLDHGFNPKNSNWRHLGI